jgi:threonine/homoserine/homoserine lactone efflux protein
MAHGPMAGYAAATGMIVGSFIYVVLTVLGIAAIFKYSPMAYVGLKLIGAGYLVYLGYQYFAEPEVDIEQNPQLATLATGKILRQSLIVELTNPKTALFFLAFLPQFVDEQVGNVAFQLMILGSLYAIVAFFCDLSVATAAGKLGRWLAQHPNSIIWQDRFAGTVLIGLGIYICYETLITHLG